MMEEEFIQETSYLALEDSKMRRDGLILGRSSSG